MNAVIGNRLILPRYEIFRDGLVVQKDWEKKYSSDDKLISISFKNTGDVDVVINGKWALNADSAMMTFGSENGVYDGTKYVILFDKATTGTNPKIEVYLTSEIQCFVEEIVIPLTEKIK